MKNIIRIWTIVADVLRNAGAILTGSERLGIRLPERIRRFLNFFATLNK